MTTWPVVPHYSGDRSQRFWSRILALKHDATRARLSRVGCRLQIIEYRVLTQLHAAEQKAKCTRQNRARQKSPGPEEEPLSSYRNAAGTWSRGHRFPA